jgi:hypothetical protein
VLSGGPEQRDAAPEGPLDWSVHTPRHSMTRRPPAPPGSDGGDTPRAQRFPFHLPVRFRTQGAKSWDVGRIENISRSGVLFWSERVYPPDTALEILFALPLGGLAPGVACRGRIVRTVSAPAPLDVPGMAATITAYRFVRGDYASA